MTRRSWKLLIALVIGVTAGLSLVGYGLWSMFSYVNNFEYSRGEVPAGLRDARIFTGADRFTKAEVFKLTKESLLSTIGKSVSIEDEKERQRLIEGDIARQIYNFSDLQVIGGEIVAVGEFGGFMLDSNGTLKKSFLFEPVAQNIKLGPYEQTTYRASLNHAPVIVGREPNKIGFLSFGPIDGATVYDDEGNVIWSYGGDPIDLSAPPGNDKDFGERKYVVQAAVGDLDGDGVSEYIVARNADGVHAFDNKGNEKWFQRDDSPHGPLSVRDIDGDGKNELVALGQVTRDGNCKKVGDKMGTSYETLIMKEGKDKKMGPVFCSIDQGKFLCRNTKGETVVSGDAPLSEVKKVDTGRHEGPAPTPVHLGNGVQAIPVKISSTNDTDRIYQPRAVWVSFSPGKTKYLAVLGAFAGLPRSNLYIYDADGKLVYHELIDQRSETIAVQPVDGGNEQLLVGGKDTIWRYTLN